MPQKFMLIAVAGYVLFASAAAILTTSDHLLSESRRRFTIILLHWSAVIVFVVASLPLVLQTSSPLTMAALWPIPAGMVAALFGALALTIAYRLQRMTGWWSPLPWLRGLVVATAATAWASASQGARSALLPDWRFIGASLALWAVCLILADIALFSSRRASGGEPSSRMVKELLRLCAVLPALLIYMIGIQI